MYTAKWHVFGNLLHAEYQWKSQPIEGQYILTQASQPTGAQDIWPEASQLIEGQAI